MKIKRQTIDSRIKRGMTREQAENTPLLVVRVLKKVLEIEPHGLSVCNGAYVLGVTPSSLSKFLKTHKIAWRGKEEFKGKDCIDTLSNAQKIRDAGVGESAVYTQMWRNKLSFDDALEKVIKLKIMRASK